MRAHGAALWENLRTSYWFIPSIMAVGAWLLAAVAFKLDLGLQDKLVNELPWIYTGGPEGARQLLSTVASSVITVAGTTFSITIAALSLASGQFGPRLLRNFMSDRGNQLVLGTFTCTFLYCLLILRTIRGTEDISFVPHISVTVGIGLAVLSLGVLIYFIHHVAESIQVSHLIGSVGKEGDAAMRRLFPDLDPAHAAVAVPDGPPSPVLEEAGGYVQAVDDDALLKMAEDNDLVLRLLVRPGDYVIPGDTIVEVWPQQSERVARKIRHALAYGRQRTSSQDAEFALLQLVEIAVRALSPGINDPFTAMMCIDRIAATLHILARAERRHRHRCDARGRLRVITRPYQSDELVGAAFELIIHSARQQPIVLGRIIYQIERLLTIAEEPLLREALGRQRALALA